MLRWLLSKLSHGAMHLCGCCDCRYVSGRTRKPGEINGKSANLNNCLKNVIYAGYLAAPGAKPGDGCTGTAGESPGDVESASSATGSTGAVAAGDKNGSSQRSTVPDIPPQEVVVVFDADMVCKPGFFQHVSVLLSALCAHSGHC